MCSTCRSIVGKRSIDDGCQSIYVRRIGTNADVGVVNIHAPSRCLLAIIIECHYGIVIAQHGVWLCVWIYFSRSAIRIQEVALLRIRIGNLSCLDLLNDTSQHQEGLTTQTVFVWSELFILCRDNAQFGSLAHIAHLDR